MDDQRSHLLMLLAMSLTINVILGIRVIDYRQGRSNFEARP